MVEQSQRRSEAEFASLEEELRSYREEKEKIRHIIGQIGGEEDRRRDRLINIIFITLLLLLLAADITGHIYPHLKIMPTLISLEIAVLMVSLKVIWMIHKQAKVEHFQFWILNAIEFRLNEVTKRLREMEPRDK
ncbi:hypothetical protein GF348_12255 [candidate division KSB3 bacterium]|nr:hypothetical protein [candidate division KSB3 bacterium]